MSEQTNLTRLDWLRAEHSETLNPHYTEFRTPSNLREDIGYLLAVVHLLEEQVNAQALAFLDPDNDTTTATCRCYYEIVDDAGSTIVGEYNPECRIHGKHDL